jgi:cytochrome b561
LVDVAEIEMAVLKGYSFTQIRLHWVIAVLIVGQLIFGEEMGEAWEAVEDGQVPEMGLMVWGHIIAGVAVLALAVWRLGLRFGRGAPPPPEVGSALAHMAAHVGHWALYALMVALPVSGLVAWYGGVEAAAEAHEIMKPITIILVAVHVVAALWHQFYLKDGLLMRMKRPLD